MLASVEEGVVRGAGGSLLLPPSRVLLSSAASEAGVLAASEAADMKLAARAKRGPPEAPDCFVATEAAVVVGLG